MTGHLPALPDLKNLGRLVSGGLAEKLATAGRLMFTPGHLVRSDGLDPDPVLADLRTRHRQAVAAGDAAAAQQAHALHSRLASISELTPDLYADFAANPASIGNWLPALADAVTASGSHLQIPPTSVVRLPAELAQYLRLEYTTTNAVSRQTTDEIIADLLDLDTAESNQYFLKTGTFSSKFEFANALCAEPAEAGQYLHAVNNMAMSLGAGDCVEVCARGWIAPPEGTPTIYHGMPLRCEMRAFIDLGFDHVEAAPADREPEPGCGLVGITPYWHPAVMKRGLALAESEPGMSHIRGDRGTYMAHLPQLEAGFDAHREPVAGLLQELVEPLRQAGLAGAWSVDVLIDTAGCEEGEARYWLIDAAPMRTSALAEQLRTTDEYRLAPLERVLELSNEQVLDLRHWRSRLMAPGMPGAGSPAEPAAGDAPVIWRYRWNRAVGTADTAYVAAMQDVLGTSSDVDHYRGL